MLEESKHIKYSNHTTYLHKYWYSCFEIIAQLLCHFHQFELGLEL